MIFNTSGLEVLRLVAEEASGVVYLRVSQVGGGGSSAVSGEIIVGNGPGASAVNIQDGGNSITIDASSLDIRPLSASADTVTVVQDSTWNVDVLNTVGVSGTVSVSEPVTVDAVDLDIRNIAASADSISAVQSGGWNVDVLNTVAVSGTVSVVEPITVDAVDLDIRNLSASADFVSVSNTVAVSGTISSTQSGTWILGANSGVDIGDVTVNNGSGSAAVNIQDGGNSITIDAASLPLPTGAATLAAQNTTNSILGQVIRAESQLAETGIIVASVDDVDGRAIFVGSSKYEPPGAGVIVGAVHVNPRASSGDELDVAAAITSLGVIDDIAHSANSTLSKGVPMMGQFDDTSTATVTENNVGAARITGSRGIHVNLRNNSGTEVGNSVANAMFVKPADGSGLSNLPITVADVSGFGIPISLISDPGLNFLTFLPVGGGYNAVIAREADWEYETVAASQTDQVIGATGAAGDYIKRIIVTVSTAASGTCSIKDGSGGATISLTAANTPIGAYTIDLGITSTSNGWRVTTGGGATALVIGNFT